MDTDIEPPRRRLKFATEMGHIQEETEHFHEETGHIQEEMEHFHEEMRHFLLGIRVTGARLSEPQHVRTSYVTGKSPRLPVWRSCCGSGDPRSNGGVNREPHEPREPYIF